MSKAVLSFDGPSRAIVALVLCRPGPHACSPIETNVKSDVSNDKRGGKLHLVVVTVVHISTILLSTIITSDPYVDAVI